MSMRDDEWLVVIDRQNVFAQDWSDWACANGSFHDADSAFERLARAYGDRVAYTRYVAASPVKDAWSDYFKEWPQFLVPPEDPMYRLTEETERFARWHPVVSCSTFGKWGDELAKAIQGSKRIVLCGVSTDCCVLATALAAADAGVSVRVATDACMGSTPENHQLALDTMALFSPLIELTDSGAILS